MSSFIDEVLEWREKAYREYEGTKIGIEVDYRKIYANGLTEKHRESAKQQLLAEVLDIIAKTTRTTVLGEKWLFEQELIDKAKERFK